VWIESLGCAKNLVDSEVMLGFLVNEGFSLAEVPEKADLIVVNTCGFIESASEESIEAILEMADAKEKGACKGLIVAGCLYQRYGEKLREELPEVDAFLGCGELKKIATISRAMLTGKEMGVAKSPETPKYIYNDRAPRGFLNGITSVYVKIAEGCDNRCSYCTIPLLRGSYRSRSIESVAREVRGLLRQGTKEINLIAQDTTHFGFPEAGEEKLTYLLRKLGEIKGKKWLRLLYAHPARTTAAVARAIGDSDSVCHYLDMPIQHISDSILKAMGRRGGSDEIRKAIDVLRNEIPDIALRTTLMVGFPGETDRHFEKLLEFLREERFDRVGAFKYSPEPETPAARLRKKVPEEVKEERYDALMREQAVISNKLNHSLIGKRMEVLIESKDECAPNTFIGRTYRDAPEVDGFIRVSGKRKGSPIGEFIQVRITKAHDYDLEGEWL